MPKSDDVAQEAVANRPVDKGPSPLNTKFGGVDVPVETPAKGQKFGGQPVPAVDVATLRREHKARHDAEQAGKGKPAVCPVCEGQRIVDNTEFRPWSRVLTEPERTMTRAGTRRPEWCPECTLKPESAKRPAPVSAAPLPISAAPQVEAIPSSPKPV